ncbi:hypothetical protein AA0113_g1579 [Alternaria arborescens]|uniref:Uncharacterized protein n=1 Tax=Alternaria arborescens TaxID=156630 RepID=A0A4Q4SNL6_9PLEO|nr:hypothetical protein AA0113_g1579 [Alternaria arborescens]
MAREQRPKYMPFDLNHHQESLDDTYQSEYESDSLNDVKQHEINENELNTREPETKDAGLRAQDKSGKAVFKKQGAKAIEKQPTVEIDAHVPTDPDSEYVWKMKTEERVPIQDSWAKIDEEDAPVPKTWLPKRFQGYPEDAESEIDPEMADNPAYLRQIIRSMAKQYARCRAELKEEEAFRIRAEWERNMAQRKAKRYWSYSIHVTDTVALPIYKTQQIEDIKLRKREKDVTAREQDVKLDRLALQSERAEFESVMERFRNEAIEAKNNLKVLRDKFLDDDAIKQRLRQDIWAEKKTAMMEERASRQLRQHQKQQELSSGWRNLDLERNASKQKKELVITNAVKEELISEAYELGEAVGKRFTAVEQYNRGYQYQEGMKAGEEEMSKKRDLEIEYLKRVMLKEVADSRDVVISRTEERTEARLAEKFRVWMQERETAIRRNSRAYGLYEGTITQIRRQNNVEGSEREEDALATIIATTMANQMVTALYTYQTQKTCWRNTTNEESPLWMNSEVVEKSKFYKALHPKLTKEWHKATDRFKLAKQEQEQEKQKQAHAARVENEWATRDATAQREEGEFVPVESGAPAPYRHRLPFIVEEPLETDESQEMSDKDMVATFLKNIRDQ